MQAIQNYFHQVLHTSEGKGAIATLVITVALVAATVLLALTVCPIAGSFIAILAFSTAMISFAYFYSVAHQQPQLPPAV